MIAFRQPGGAAAPVEIWIGDRFLAALRPAPEVQRLQFSAPLRPAATEQYLRGWIAGAMANQGRGDLVMSVGFDGRPRPPHSGPVAPRGAAERSEASPVDLSSPAECPAGPPPGLGVSSLNSAAGVSVAANSPVAGRHPFEEETPYRWIAQVYGLVYRPGDRERATPFVDMTGTVQSPPDGAVDGGRVVVVEADGCGSPMHWHPCDLVRLVGQGDGRREGQR